MNEIAVPRTAHIKFFAAVDQSTIGRLMTAVEQKLKEGIGRFVLLISSPGGNVFDGLSAYNFLRGIPAEVVTHNFGSADSIASVIYCAGAKRLCAPQGRFLLHGIGFDVQGARFDEKMLEERVKDLRDQRESISKIVSEASGQPLERVEQDILQGTVLNAQDAVEYGLVHAIKSQLFESVTDILAIQ